ncbi:hypothetical protein C8Q76DRAFT_760482 [Earliella scabrosa]|nr:hypothetical protein C8Q76DRAFT_760482 [Earliella scabrosa]
MSFYRSTSKHSATIGLSDMNKNLLDANHDSVTFGGNMWDYLSEKDQASPSLHWFDPVSGTSIAPFDPFATCPPSSSTMHFAGSNQSPQPSSAYPRAPLLAMAPPLPFDAPVPAWVSPNTHANPSPLESSLGLYPSFPQYASEPSAAGPLTDDDEDEDYWPDDLIDTDPPSGISAPSSPQPSITSVESESNEEGVWRPVDTIMRFYWADLPLPPMPANDLWRFLKTKLQILRDPGLGAEVPCLWPGCGEMQKRDYLRKHVRSMHQRIKAVCRNPGCNFAERDDMFKQRHRTCAFGAPGEKPQYELKICPW